MHKIAIPYTIVRMACMALLIAVFATPLQASAATGSSAAVLEAQKIMTKFGIPTGELDGDYGPQTARGLCTFRLIAGLPVTRNNVDSTTLAKLRSYNTSYASLGAIPAPKQGGERTYVRVNETCQVLVYVENGRYVTGGAIPVTTGKKGHGTPNSTPKRTFRLGYTQKGWHCSTLYPDNEETGTCNRQTAGRFATSSSRGNMYNSRHVTGGIYIHGSTAIRTYPASHGCIRVPVAASDWMYDHVGNGARPLLIIEGDYAKG